MKNICFILLMVFYSSFCKAQDTTLNENFDVSCSISGFSYPPGWHEFNVIPNVDSMGWRCNATKGRDGTPGMRCLGYYSGAYHLDTAWLFTPALALHSYSNNIYLRFDSKFEVGVEFHKLSVHVFKYRSDTATTNPILDTTEADVTSILSPVISNADSFGWVTHEVNLTPYKIYPTIHVAFRYVSSNIAAGEWAIDNLLTSPYSLYIDDIKSKNSTLELYANSENEQLNISYYSTNIGNYFLAMYDITGREVYKQNIKADSKKETITIADGQFQKGLYLLKMWNDQSTVFTKVILGLSR